jgi:uncharacterized protein YqgC (DUF456 family)
MDILLVIIAVILLLISVAGCVSPLLPGPPLTYISLLLLHFTKAHQFTNKFLIIMAAVAIGVTIIDNIIPILGAKSTVAVRKQSGAVLSDLSSECFFFRHGE